MQFKQGDIFDFTGTVSLTVNGKIVKNMTGWTARSQIRTRKDQLVSELSFEWVNITVGALRIYHDGSTQSWPLEHVEIDVQFTSPAGSIISTETTSFVIVKDVTHD